MSSTQDLGGAVFVATAFLSTALFLRSALPNTNQKTKPSNEVSLTPEIIATIKATAPVVAQKVVEITTTFYGHMFRDYPVVLPFFNETNQIKGMQQRALAESVVAYALNIDNLGALGPVVSRIVHRHVALAVTPDLYPVVHKVLMQAIGEVLGPIVTPEIAHAWSQSVLFLAKILIDAEEALYKEISLRQGGWRGEREFRLCEKTKVAEDTVKFTFKPVDGYNGPFEFEPGQYLTIRAPTVRAPRHYTVTSKPGVNYLEITTRKVENGKMSIFLHEDLKIGGVVKLAAPVGVFKTDPNLKEIVLISGGIGITPMYAFLKNNSNVKALFHVAKSEDRVPYMKEIIESGIKTKFYYSKEGRPNLEKEIGELVRETSRDATFFLCCGVEMMKEIEAVLNKNGVKDVRTEVFGTGTVSKCPVPH